MAKHSGRWASTTPSTLSSIVPMDWSSASSIGLAGTPNIIGVPVGILRGGLRYPIFSFYLFLPLGVELALAKVGDDRFCNLP